MNETIFRLIYVGTDLIAPLIAGYLAYQRGFISDARCNTVIRFNIIVMATLLALLSHLQVNMQVRFLRWAWLAHPS